MHNYTLPSLILFLLLFISVPQLRAQITLNNSGSATFDNHATINGNTNILGHTNMDGTLKVGSASGSNWKVGISCSGCGSFTRYGAHITTTGSSSTNYGVYASASGGSSNRGIYATASGSNNLAGYFNGDIYTTGNYQGSDQRLKKEIESLREAGILAKINQLDPKRYQYLNEEELRSQRLPSLNATEGTHFGLLAQEVEEVFPELVRDVVSVLGEETGELSEDPEMVTTKAINYQELSVLLLAAIQEMQSRIESLESSVQGR